MSNHDTAHGYLAVMVDKLNHVLAHANGYSDYCQREFVLDGARGLIGQVLHVWDLLTEDQQDEVARAIDPELSRDDFNHTTAGLARMLWDGSVSESELADAIEEWSDFLWEDGDVFLCEPCELLDPDGEFYLGQDDLSVEYLRDENGEVAHLRVCWTFGGPNAYLVRGWFGDRLLVAWGAEVAEHYGHEVTDLLDHYADILA